MVSAKAGGEGDIPYRLRLRQLPESHVEDKLYQQLPRRRLFELWVQEALSAMMICLLLNVSWVVEKHGCNQ